MESKVWKKEVSENNPKIMGQFLDDPLLSFEKLAGKGFKAARVNGDIHIVGDGKHRMYQIGPNKLLNSGKCPSPRQKHASLCFFQHRVYI